MPAPVAAEPRIMALTVRQPYAWAIAEGFKPVENRGWRTNYRGLLAIHAAGRFDDGFPGFPARDADRKYRALKAQALLAGAFPPEAVRLGFRRVVAVARLTGIHHASECMAPEGEPPRVLCCPWAIHGEHHWELPDVWPLDPVPCHPGMLGLWRLPEDVEKAVRAQLEGAERDCPGRAHAGHLRPGALDTGLPRALLGVLRAGQHDPVGAPSPRPGRPPGHP